MLVIDGAGVSKGGVGEMVMMLVTDSDNVGDMVLVMVRLCW